MPVQATEAFPSVLAALSLLIKEKGEFLFQRLSPESKAMPPSIFHFRASLVVQGLPVQGTRVRSLVWEDPTCRGAAKSVHHNY